MKPLAANSLLQNRYLIIHHIGKGGMGEVYLSVDQRLGNPVALKRTVFRDDAMMWDAFEREARILARLRHPVLPKVSDHFSEKEEQYLVMEYISGDDLSKRLDTAKKPFPLQWVLYWADELLDALSYLHTHEPPIIHRDIKPQNLKLASDNHVVLLDFGLAKNSVPQKTNMSSSSGSLVGYTPHYAPIEQIRGTGTSARSDIYSLSATLYQLMTGSVPLDALTRAESVIGGSGDSLPSPTEIVPEIPQEISTVILKGMALNSEQRYSDAKEMQKALRQAYAAFQQAASQTEDFDGAETVVPEKKAESPEEELSSAKTAAFIFNNDDVDGMFKAAQDPPVTLTPETVIRDDEGRPVGNMPDFAATIPAEQWSEGDTQGFSHDEIRRSTIDEDAFKKFGFDAEAARSQTADESEPSFMPSPFINQEDPREMEHSEVAAAAAAVAAIANADKPTPIRPVTRPLDPAAKPAKQPPKQAAKQAGAKKASSGWGLKFIAIAAVLCFMVAAVGAGGWYAVSNKLITIPGLEQKEVKAPATDGKPGEPNETETKAANDPLNGGNDADPALEAGKKDSQADAALSGGNTDQPAETRSANTERKSQPAKQANPQKTNGGKTEKTSKDKAKPTDILQ